MGGGDGLHAGGHLAGGAEVTGATSSMRQSELRNVPAPIVTREPYRQRNGGRTTTPSPTEPTSPRRSRPRSASAACAAAS